MRQHTLQEPGFRSQQPGSCVRNTEDPLIRTHTVGDRGQGSGIRVRPEDNTIPRSTPTPDAPASVTDPHQHPTSIAQAAPDRHRLRGDRRLAGCQNPLHIVQDPGDRNQEPGYRPPFTAS
jgi:hypothetical protein